MPARAPHPPLLLFTPPSSLSQAKNVFEVGTAINCIANICTPDLARDLLSDMATMLTSSRPYIRKKATLAMYKLYLQCVPPCARGARVRPHACVCDAVWPRARSCRYPQGLRLTFEQLRARLGDENVSVQSCAVNVICELANKKPKNYLMLAQELFGLLGSSHNNWMLIKVAKVRACPAHACSWGGGYAGTGGRAQLLGSLVEEEPRLARKLLEPLANIVSVTPAKSLMCARAWWSGGGGGGGGKRAVVDGVCVQVRVYLDDHAVPAAHEKGGRHGPQGVVARLPT